MVLTPASWVLLDHVPDPFARRWTTRILWRDRFHRGQVAPLGDWAGWVIQAGRGFGKTLVGAIDAAEHCLDYDHYRYGIVAPTLGDARDTCMEGETGLVTMLTAGNNQMPGLGLAEGTDFSYNRSRLELTFNNGSHVKAFGSERPDRLRGPQHHRLWFEELATFSDAWKGDALGTTFNNALLGLRLQGRGPTRYIVTTTPRPLKLMTEIVERPDVAVTRGSTYDNLANLSEEFKAVILGYEGTHLARQELAGEIISDHPDALWRWAYIDDHRIETPPPMVRILVGVDPAAGAGATGIVGAGRIGSPCPCGREDVKGPHFAVLADATVSASPEGWGRAAIALYDELAADRIIAERNQGGDMVTSTLRQVDPRVPVKMVHASRGKTARAEPIVVLYEQGRVHHVGALPELEAQLTSWVPWESGWSPDRLDALVWAVTELVGPGSGPHIARSPVTVRMPG